VVLSQVKSMGEGPCHPAAGPCRSGRPELIAGL